MRNLFSGRRRYALACLVAVGGLVTAAASCEPTKTPPKEPAPTGLSIDPTDWDFSADPGTATFTVTNHGPDTTNALVVDLVDGTDFDITGGNCNGATLDPDATCTVTAEFNPATPGEHMTDLVVDDPNDGQAVAILIGGG